MNKLIALGSLVFVLVSNTNSQTNSPWLKDGERTVVLSVESTGLIPDEREWSRDAAAEVVDATIKALDEKGFTILFSREYIESEASWFEKNHVSSAGYAKTEEGDKKLAQVLRVMMQHEPVDWKPLHALLKSNDVFPHRRLPWSGIVKGEYKGGGTFGIAPKSQANLPSLHLRLAWDSRSYSHPTYGWSQSVWRCAGRLVIGRGSATLREVSVEAPKWQASYSGSTDAYELSARTIAQAVRKLITDK